MSFSEICLKIVFLIEYPKLLMKQNLKVLYLPDRIRSKIIVFWWNKFQNHTGRRPTWDWYWFITGGPIGGQLCFYQFSPLDHRWLRMPPQWSTGGTPVYHRWPPMDCVWFPSPGSEIDCVRWPRLENRRSSFVHARYIRTFNVMSEINCVFIRRKWSIEIITLYPNLDVRYHSSRN